MLKVHRLTRWSLFNFGSYITNRRNGGHMMGAGSN